MLPLPQEGEGFFFILLLRKVNNYIVIPVSDHAVVLRANSTLVWGFFCLFWRSQVLELLSISSLGS